MPTSASKIRPCFLPELELFRPSTVEDIFSLLEQDVQVLAGGTDVLLWASQRGQPRKLASIANIDALRTFNIDGKRLQVGANITMGELIRCAAFRHAAPAVTDGAQLVGSLQLRNQATLIGNVCTASPAGDTLPGLLVHNAQVEITAATGQQRQLALDDFLIGPGQTALSHGELVLSVYLDPLQPNEASAYQRHTEREALDLAFASAAVLLGFEADGHTIASARLALGAVGPTALIAAEAAKTLVGHPLTEVKRLTCATMAAETSAPITDFRASADYRRHLVKVLVDDVLIEAQQRAQHSKQIQDKPCPSDSNR